MQFSFNGKKVVVAGGSRGIWSGAFYVDGNTTAGYRDQSDLDAHTFHGRVRVTPTESAAVAVVVALLVGTVVFRELSLGQAPGILRRTAANSATVMFLIAAAKIFGWLLTYYTIPQQAAAFIQSLTSSPTVYLLLVFGLLLLVGTVLEGIAALIILVPILQPVARGVYQIDPIHFGIVMCLTLILGLVTPPVGTGLYIASAVAKVDIMRLSRIMLPFIVATAVVILVVIFVPQLVTLRF